VNQTEPSERTITSLGLLSRLPCHWSETQNLVVAVDAREPVVKPLPAGRNRLLHVLNLILPFSY
jgi:hypothetical protein